MRHQFTIPAYWTIGGNAYETGETECAVELEPDEATCLTSWYIARVYVEVRERRKFKMLSVAPTDPVFELVKAWALKECAEHLEAEWEKYLDDLPRSRRPLTDRKEHSTHWGRP